MKERILSILEKDARASYENIATMLGITVEEVKKTVDECVADGTIIAYRTVIDWDKTQKAGVTALIELKTIPQRDKGFDSVAERICNFPEVKSVCLMSGGFDLAITVECNNMRDVAFFVAEKLATIEGVTATATHFELQKYKENGVVYSNEKVDKRGNSW
ncbi:MAG: Lrp/AsnC family transcriptional regulator [Clostridia bacterium]|nr:Lrp/AsnC family transcriptional regulator [Clostridia bacterium]MBQ9847542.1 Lrp/AsnC family transcriptional regulator [Clostridia bacterium]